MAGMVIETSKEWRESEGRRLVDLIDGDLDNRSDWEAARIASRDLYYGDSGSQVVHTARGRLFQSATDIHAPVVFENIERIKPKMNNAIWGAWPHVIVERVPEEYDPTETRIQEMFINWAMEYDIEGLFNTTLAWFGNMLLDGVGVVKTAWVTEWRRTCEVHRIKRDFVRGDMTPTGFKINEEGRQKSISDILDELFGSGNWNVLADNEDGTLDLALVEDRRLIQDVRVVFTDRSQFVDEVEILVHRPILVRDSVDVSVVETEDLIVPYKTRNPQSAKRITHRHWMTVDEIEAEARPDRFDPWILDEGDVAKLKAAAADTQWSRDSHNNNAFTMHKDAIEGVIPGSQQDEENNQLQIYEVYLKKDINGDGLREDLVLQVSPDLNKVLHITFLDTLHPHGHRPFSTIHFLPPTDRFYVPGLAQFLAPINIQANITLNQVNDRQTLVNNPIGFYRPMALPQDPDAMEALEPGDMIPTPDPDGIRFPDWGKAPLADLSIMETVLLFADRIGSSPIQGGSPQIRNMPRTARGTLALISEGNLKVDILVDTAQREGFSELMYQLFGLYSTFMPDEKYFWATGHDRKRGPEMVSRRMLRGKLNFKFRGNTINTNPEVQRTLSQIRYQVASLDPLYLQDPVKRRELLRDFLSAHTEGGDVERILPDLPGQGAEPHQPMPQSSENIAMRLHQPVEVLWSDNDLQHIADLDALAASPAFETFDDVTVTLMAQHRIQHMQNQARKRQMSALQETTGMGARMPADLGLGNLEGGTA